MVEQDKNGNYTKVQTSVSLRWKETTAANKTHKRGDNKIEALN